MCPERQIISLYYDGELPSPWKEKLEVHLSNCPECRAVLAEYGNLGSCLSDTPDEVLLTAQERVWKKLSSLESLKTGAEAWQTKPRPRAWKWNITIPIPLAAAAALVIIASLTFIGVSALNRSPAHNQVAAANIAFDEQSIVPVTDITGVIQYLSTQGLGDFMVIRLPESPRFSRAGEPVLINAADYSRRTAFR